MEEEGVLESRTQQDLVRVRAKKRNISLWVLDNSMKMLIKGVSLRTESTEHIETSLNIITIIIKLRDSHHRKNFQTQLYSQQRK